MALTFVLPVSQAGIDRLKWSIDTMEFFGGLQKHTVRFFGAPSIMPKLAEQASRIKAICPNTFVDSLPREPEGPAPFGAFNAIFRDSVELLYMLGNKNPWFWWEEDMFAIKPGWADRLELEYHQKGMPFLGVRRKASEVMREAKTGEPLDEKDPRALGDYMVAVGIYPPDFRDKYSTMYKYPDPTGKMPTDVIIRHEINRYLHNTNLIGHHYKTGNYRKENGVLVCDDLDFTPGFPSYAGQVSDMAFVVHGAKDDSLSRLILSETPHNVQTLPVQTLTASAGSAPSEALQAEIQSMRLDIQRMSEAWSQKEMSYAVEIEELKEKLAKAGVSIEINALVEADKVVRKATGMDEPEIIESPIPSTNAVSDHIKRLGKKIQLADLAADFKCNKLALRKLLETDPKFTISKNGVAWVGLAA